MTETNFVEARPLSCSEHGCLLWVRYIYSNIFKQTGANGNVGNVSNALVVYYCPECERQYEESFHKYPKTRFPEGAEL